MAETEISTPNTTTFSATNPNYEHGESSNDPTNGSGGEAFQENERSLVEWINRASNKLFVKQPSIFRVPEHLRRLNENAYTPCHISIGPFHHRDDRYSLMEEHKLVYARDLIRRNKDFNSQSNIDNNGRVPQVNNAHVIQEEAMMAYVDVVDGLEATARKSYAENIKLNMEEFVNMLLIDGCFIVEFLCRKIRKLSYMPNESTRKEDKKFRGMYEFIESEYNLWQPANDFIFQSTRTSFEVRRDLTLLENQLPYKVLEALFDFTFPGNNVKFHEIVYCALRTSIPNTSHVLTSDDVRSRIENDPEMKTHFVSFLRMCCRPLANLMIDIERQLIGGVEFPCLCDMGTPHDIRVPSATRLAKAGVQFMKASEETALLDIQFERGVLRMPPLTVWHHTETFFRNVMAHELYNHTANSSSKSVSDYMCFMDDLINSKEDVALLVQSGIIQNWLESDEVVADLFNSVTRHILADYSSYSETCKQLNDYRKRYNMQRVKVMLQGDYFTKPWAIVYFVAFVFVQTAASIIQSVTSLKDSGN